MFPRFLIFMVVAILSWPGMADDLRIPAYTAYMLPDPESARMSEAAGVVRWVDPGQTVNWYGHFQRLGALTVKLDLKLPVGVRSHLKLTVDGQSHEATIMGAGEEAVASADFGEYQLHTAGYHRIALESINEPGMPIGKIVELRLGGASVVDAYERTWTSFPGQTVSRRNWLGHYSTFLNNKNV